MSPGARLGILGGTFDPVHRGHIETARAARRVLTLDRTLLLPSRVPPHRPVQPAASPYHRFAMTALAVNEVEGVETSDVELTAPGTSYTADTLDRFQATGFRPSQIFFILGADAFAEIEAWNRYPDVLDLANFVVVPRPGYDVERIQRCLPSLSARFAPLAAASPGASSATRIFIIPAVTPDVSSTTIRQRLGRGQPVTGMVADPVEQHIHRHRLYQAGSSPLIPSAADHLHGQN